MLRIFKYFINVGLFMIQRKKGKSRWVPKKLFTVGFTGRPRRALLWRKGVYEEWFHYAKTHQASGGEIPRAFGRLSGFENFEDWWRHPDYGFELFCEPFIDSFVEETVSARGLKHCETLLKINLKGDRDMIHRDVKILLDKLIEDYEYQSAARFKPSVPMRHIQIKRLRKSRQVFELTKKGKKQAEIVTILGLPQTDLDQLASSLRRVQRYLSAYKKTCQHIEEGMFP